jgi:hypothetical protein
MTDIGPVQLVARLRDQGVITAEDFEAKKKQLPKAPVA